jgi:hypothetical protein
MSLSTSRDSPEKQENIELGALAFHTPSFDATAVKLYEQFAEVKAHTGSLRYLGAIA